MSTTTISTATEAELTRISLPLTVTPEAIKADEVAIAEGLVKLAVADAMGDSEAKSLALIVEHHRRSFTIQLKPRTVTVNGKEHSFPVPPSLKGDVADLGGASKAYSDSIAVVWDQVEAGVTRHLRHSEGFSARAAKAEAKLYVSRARDRVGYYLRLNLDEALTAEELFAYGFNRAAKLGKDQTIPEGFPHIPGLIKASPAIRALDSANTNLSAKKDGKPTDSADLAQVLANVLIVLRTVKDTRPMPTAKGQADAVRRTVKEIGLVLAVITGEAKG